MGQEIAEKKHRKMTEQRETVLVTGAEGFIGSHLVESLLRRGYKVHAMVLYNSFSSRGWLNEIDCELRRDLILFFGDIRDTQTIETAIKGCQSIVHLASLITIPYSYNAPTSYFDTNVRGTINVLQVARSSGVRRFIQVSTSEVYGSAQQIPISETHPLVGQSPYSASKIGADQAAYAFFASFGVPVVIARPFNTYGPRQSARAVIPAIMTQIIAGKKTVELGDTSTTRDFNYVNDTVEGLIALLESNKGAGEVFNIGSGYEISINDLVGCISSVAGVDIAVSVDEERLRPRNSEVQRLCADNTKIRNTVDWLPVFTGRDGLCKGLDQTFSWLSSNPNFSSYYAEHYNI